jgi:hypothetical protein
LDDDLAAFLKKKRRSKNTVGTRRIAVSVDFRVAPSFGEKRACVECKTVLSNAYMSANNSKFTIAISMYIGYFYFLEIKSQKKF